MTILTIPVQRLPHNPDLPLPAAASELAAGLDLQACITDPIILAPGKRTLVPTGLSIALPPGYEAQVRPRSGLAVRYGVTVLNAPGTIDADYRGEIAVILINHGDDPFTIERGMSIAQMVVAQVQAVQLQPADTLAETGRGTGGFGSTGS